MNQTFAFAVDPDGVQDEISTTFLAPGVEEQRALLHRNLGPGYSSLPLGRYVVHSGNRPFEEEVNRYGQQLWTGLASGGRAPFFRGTVLVTGRRGPDDLYSMLNREELRRLAGEAESTLWVPSDGPVVAGAQLQGLRKMQCDALAVHRDRARGVWAFVVCDGVGDTADVASFVRDAAPELARLAAATGSAGDAIRMVRAQMPHWPARSGADSDPTATAVVATWHPDWQEVDVAWVGDSRAYLLSPSGRGELLTADHNMAQMKRTRGVPVDRWDHNLLLSELGYGEIGERTVRRNGADVLLLCTDGSYAQVADGDPNALPGGVDRYPVTILDLYPAKSAAEVLVRDAVEASRANSLAVDGEERADNATALVVALPSL
ncbi:PP2C family protein-serine/threonine phosphatase [Kitasatospora sp. NPDC094019]|uniref:PP2C family protein-serine/threonine phosphatase n=1 Tax=Kitasatospora sp. NPDC094019 TaxID=3364091 RepID=UPI0037F691E7